MHLTQCRYLARIKVKADPSIYFFAPGYLNGMEILRRIAVMVEQDDLVLCRCFKQRPQVVLDKRRLLCFAKDNCCVFIKDNLGPLFKTSGIKTKIILFDLTAMRRSIPSPF